MARADGKDRGLFERPPGSGVWWIHYHDQFGKRHREKIGSKSSARLAYTKRKGEVLQGKKLPELNRRELSIQQLVDKYGPEIRANKKSAAWDERIGKLWVAEVGEVGIERLQPGDIERIKARWLTKFKPATVNRRLAFLKTLYGKAVRDGLATVNPLAAGRVKLLRESPPRERILTEAEEASIGEALGVSDRLAMTIGLYTGLRISEQLGRKRTDLHLARDLLYIPEAKGGGRQEVRLNPTARGALQEVLELHRSEWLFPNPSGNGPISRRNLSDRFRKACDRLGLTDVTWHSLRHTFISRLVMLGVPLVTVQKLARHKSIQMTLRYSHLAPDHTQEALNRLSGRKADIRTEVSFPAEVQEWLQSRPEGLSLYLLRLVQEDRAKKAADCTGQRPPKRPPPPTRPRKTQE